MLGKSVVHTPLDFPKKCAWRSAVEGRTREMLFTEATNFELLLDLRQVWFFGHGLLPKPIVKKNRFWTVLGMCKEFSGGQTSKYPCKVHDEVGGIEGRESRFE